MHTSTFCKVFDNPLDKSGLIVPHPMDTTIHVHMLPVRPKNESILRGLVYVNNRFVMDVYTGMTIDLKFLPKDVNLVDFDHFNFDLLQHVYSHMPDLKSFTNIYGVFLRNQDRKLIICDETIESIESIFTRLGMEMPVKKHIHRETSMMFKQFHFFDYEDEKENQCSESCLLKEDSNSEKLKEDLKPPKESDIKSKEDSTEDIKNPKRLTKRKTGFKRRFILDLASYKRRKRLSEVAETIAPTLASTRKLRKKCARRLQPKPYDTFL